jgi:hypothetical protein
MKPHSCRFCRNDIGASVIVEIRDFHGRHDAADIHTLRHAEAELHRSLRSGIAHRHGAGAQSRADDYIGPAVRVEVRHNDERAQKHSGRELLWRHEGRHRRVFTRCIEQHAESILRRYEHVGAAVAIHVRARHRAIHVCDQLRRGELHLGLARADVDQHVDFAEPVGLDDIRLAIAVDIRNNDRRGCATAGNDERRRERNRIGAHARVVEQYEDRAVDITDDQVGLAIAVDISDCNCARADIRAERRLRGRKVRKQSARSSDVEQDPDAERAGAVLPHDQIRAAVPVDIRSLEQGRIGAIGEPLSRERQHVCLRALRDANSGCAEQQRCEANEPHRRADH